MGKLIDKLKQIGQGSTGSLGFAPRRETGSAPRPAATLVTLRAGDVAAAEAAAKAGVDGIIVAGWKPGANVSTLSGALDASHTLWGVEYEGAGEDEPVKAALSAGAGFILLGEKAAVGALFDEAKNFDRIVTITPPLNEADFLTLRVMNALPAQAALVTLPAGVADLAGLNVAAFARLAIIAESLRYPLLAAVNDVPDYRACHALVRLGVDGIVLSGVGVEAGTLAKQIRAVSADMEKIPPLSQRESVSLSGLMSGAGGVLGVPPKRPEPAPETEPDEE
ncbi:MAG TPA: hypothetical protein VF808_08675 [Ktedonobacterales bacterium]